MKKINIILIIIAASLILTLISCSYFDEGTITPETTNPAILLINQEKLTQPETEFLIETTEVQPETTEPQYPSDSIGIVLAGGGTKGAYQAGALKALYELGLLDNVKCVAGTSIGSLNMMVCWGGSVEKLSILWHNVNEKDFVDPQTLQELAAKYHSKEEILIDVLSGSTDMAFSRDGLKNLLKANIDFNKISNSNIKFFATATEIDFLEAKARYFLLNDKDERDIIKRVLASSAIPVVYEAENIGGKIYLDGGLEDNVPIKPVYDEGIRKIIVVSLDSDYTVSGFEDAEIKLIRPSQDISEGLLNGALNFDQEHLDILFNLGYSDTMNYFGN